MSNRSVRIFVLLAVAALVAMLFFAMRQARSRYDWRERWSNKAYSEDNDQPYGTQVLYRLLERYFPGNSMEPLYLRVKDGLPVDSSATSSYVFIGGGMYYDSLDQVRLLEFVAAGNTALILSKTAPYALMTNLLDSNCTSTGWQDYDALPFGQVALSLPEMKGDAHYSFHFAEKNQPKSYFWSYVDARHFCSGDVSGGTPLGFLNDSLVCFARFPYGNGSFLLHTVPLAFTNYHLLREEVRPYAAAVLSYLPEGKIYWDATSRVPEEMVRPDYAFGRSLPDEHPLTYLLQHASLAWAWYLLLALAALYLLFRAKRRQRVIPVLPKNENSSYEFISTIANLHFLAKNYRGMSVQGMKLFTARLRERYGLVAAFHPDSDLPRVDDAFFDRLSRVSGVPEAQIRDIFTRYGHCVRYEPTEAMMVELHLAMEAFFKQAK